MKCLAHVKFTVMALLTVFACMLVPVVVQANSEPSSWWIDDITGAITFYKEGGHYKKDYPQANWDLYLEQIKLVRAKFRTGDVEATYVTMNRFMDMLEAREGGIPFQAAHELFNFCNLVTPAQFHDVWRHSGPPRIEQPRLPERAQWPG